MIAVYVRVSTEEQAKRGYSISDQLRECRKRAGEKALAEYVDEGISGEVLDRPALTRLRQEIREGRVETVICLDPDRLSRKLMNQLILSEEIEKKARLVFVNGEYQNTPEGKLFYQMRGAISEFEKAKINERMSRGRREKARHGKVVRDYRIYGYDYDRSRGNMVINPCEAAVVQMVFHLFTGRMDGVEGINGIARFLTAQRIPTKRGAEVWHRQVVRQMLMNTVYIGEFYQNRWNTEGMLGNKFRPQEEQVRMTQRPQEDWIMVPCPLIVDREEFQQAQELLVQSRRRWAGRNNGNYLLGGLLRCSLCGNTLTGATAKYWGKPVRMYTDRKSTAGAKHKGCGMQLQADALETLVWQEVCRYLQEYAKIDAVEFLQESAVRETPEQPVQQVYQKQLGELHRKRRNLICFVMDQGIQLQGEGGQEITRQLENLTAEEADLKSRLEAAEAGCIHREAYSGYMPDFLQAIRASLNEDTLEFEGRKALIRRLVDTIYVDREHVKIQGF